MAEETAAKAPHEHGTRAVERVIEIDAPVSAVWKALTDAEELTRWFPLRAGVEPGTGGSIWMSWTDTAGAPAPIEIWEPERHLRTGPEEGAALPIATDFHLEGRGGGTVLRVVSSGFGAGDDWDYMYGAWGRGWDFELRGLRHYLERHPGQRRIVAQARAPYGSSDEEAWVRLTGPGGWFGSSGLLAATPGDRYELETSAGETLEGTTALWQPPQQFAGRVDGWNDGLFRTELCAGTATVWLSTFGVEEAEVRALEKRWRTSLEEVLPS
jgi:uncharacterized protein YndB with AHSA1/START domain